MKSGHFGQLPSYRAGREFREIREFREPGGRRTPTDMWNQFPVFKLCHTKKKNTQKLEDSGKICPKRCQNQLRVQNPAKFKKFANFANFANQKAAGRQPTCGIDRAPSNDVIQKKTLPQNSKIVARYARNTAMKWSFWPTT